MLVYIEKMYLWSFLTTHQQKNVLTLEHNFNKKNRRTRHHDNVIIDILLQKTKELSMEGAFYFML